MNDANEHDDFYSSVYNGSERLGIKVKGRSRGMSRLMNSDTERPLRHNYSHSLEATEWWFDRVFYDSTRHLRIKPTVPSHQEDGASDGIRESVLIKPRKGRGRPISSPQETGL